MAKDSYRFTAWVPFDNQTMTGDWEHVAAVELYNLTGYDGMDFDFAGMYDNIASEACASDLVASMLAELRDAVASWY